MPRTVGGLLAVYALQAVLLALAFVFQLHSVNFLVCSVWVVLIVLRIRTFWAWCYPLFLGLLCYITFQEPFRGYPWGIIPAALTVFFIYLFLYIFYRPFRQSIDKGLSFSALTLYMGHRVIGAYSFSKIIGENSAELVAAHDPLEVMNAHWVYSAGVVDFVVALAAPAAAYLLLVVLTSSGRTALVTAKPLLISVALLNVVGFADFVVVGVCYSSLLLPGPYQMPGVAVSVIPMTRFPLAVLVLGLAPVSMLLHAVSLHRIVRRWRGVDGDDEMNI